MKFFCENYNLRSLIQQSTFLIKTQTNLLVLIFFYECFSKCFKAYVTQTEMSDFQQVTATVMTKTSKYVLEY